MFITLATHPGLRVEADRLDAADAALDPHGPKGEELAAQHCAHHKALIQAIEAAGLDAAEEQLFEIYDAETGGEEDTRMSAYEAVTKMPYGFSAARTRCMELHSTPPRRGPLRRHLTAGATVPEDPEPADTAHGETLLRRNSCCLSHGRGNSLTSSDSFPRQGNRLARLLLQLAKGSE